MGKKKKIMKLFGSLKLKRTSQEMKNEARSGWNISDEKELIGIKRKKIKLSMTKCKKCKKDLDIRITTELSKSDEKKKVEPQVLIIYGYCHSCKIVYMIDLIKIKNIFNKIRRKNEKRINSKIKKKSS